MNTHKLVKEQMIEILSSHNDFHNKKNEVQRLLVRFEQQAMFIPKFHPELNPIERVWGRAKVYARNHCNYSFAGLQSTVTPALESFHLMPFSSISGNQGITFMHTGKELVVFRQMMR